MKTAQFARYGDEGVIEIVDAPIPRPGPAEVLLRVTASSVNSVDIAHRAGAMGLVTGRTFPQGLGVDAVGRIESVGTDVSGFAPGERVWAIRAGAAGMKKPTGLAAEFAIVDARRMAHAPESLDDTAAAALVVSGYTALRALRDALRLQPGGRVVIRGASGGVGSAAVSIAATMGGRVVGLASERNVEVVRALGAHEVFDYASTSPSEVGPADAVFDTVGTQLPAWQRTLRRGGRMATVALASPAALASVALSAAQGSRRIRAFVGEPPAGQLAALTAFVEAHDIRPLVHETITLDDIARAHRVFEGRGLAGKVVLTV
ncbi:NADP-dependent oxidoreductase [Microbacterium sp. RD1]|uniref:NADP-dependent oxidoreductase n=1 Tax=Microbacterium sp. RD1 TaxID=3457313 RepID=UPI003FA5F1B1